MSDRPQSSALSREAGTASPFPWRREERDGAVWFLHSQFDPGAQRGAFAMPAGARSLPLGRGGFQYDHPSLGPVRVKLYRRGGLFGKFFPEAGLDEAAAQAELGAEAALRGAGLLTQESLALRAARATPRLLALQRFFPGERTYAELAAAGALTRKQHDEAEALLLALVHLGWHHRDCNGGNLLWNGTQSRWRLIDLASAGKLASSDLSSVPAASALRRMHERLAKPPRAYRAG